MNFEPQTYEELIRMKRCVELTKYYEVTEEELWEIYHFLEQEPEAFIKGGRQNLSLIIGQNTAKTQKVIMANWMPVRRSARARAIKIQHQLNQNSSVPMPPGTADRSPRPKIMPRPRAKLSAKLMCVPGAALSRSW